MQIRRPLLVAGRWTAGLAAVLMLAPAEAQQEPDTPSAEAGQGAGAGAAAASAMSQSGSPLPAEDQLRPIPDPPRFLSEFVSTIDDINGDLFWWGQSVNLVGNIMNNAFVGGSSASIDGVVGSDVFAFAGTTYVHGEVMHNVYAFTGQLFVNDDAVIHGNLICFCGALTITGTVRGQVLGSGGTITLAGEVGSMKIEAGHLIVTSDAIVHGDLEYDANAEATIADGAQIGGEILWNQDSTDDDAGDDSSTSDESSGFGYWGIASTLWWYLANLTVGMAFLLLGGRLARAPVEKLREQAAVGLGFGFVVTVVVPVACLIAALMLVTLPLGFIVMQFYLLAVFLARLVTAQFMGDWLLRRIGQQQPSEYLALAGGLVLFFLLTEIPYVGFLIWLTALFLGVGGLFLAARGQRPAATMSG